MKNMKKKGISLIVLIITIVVIVILATAVIMNLLGDNNVIKNAKEAVELSNKQTATEKMNLKLTTIQMDSYTEKQRLPTLQEVANILSNDGEVKEVSRTSKYNSNSNSNNEVASLSADIDIGDSKSIYVTLNEFPYEFEINDFLQLASIDGVDLIESSDANDDTVTISKEEYEALNNKIDSLISRIDFLEKKTTMKTIIQNVSDNTSVPSGNLATEILNITIPEDCYADIYSRFRIKNDDSTSYKGIILYKNDTVIAANGKGGIGSYTNEDISCCIDLKAGDILTVKATQFTGSTQPITTGFIRVNYFPTSITE